MALEMIDVEISEIRWVTMIMTAMIMTHIMKIMNSFILLLYLKVVICMQHVLY